MAFQDRELTCRDCGGGFIFTAGEQEFYASKGLQHDPVRCPGCRQNRKALRPEDRDDTPNYGVYASWGGRTPRQIHPATCSGCGQVAEVPFLARGDRPVFCSDCYKREQERQQAAEEAAAAALAGLTAPRAVELEGDGPLAATDLAADDAAAGDTGAAEANSANADSADADSADADSAEAGDAEADDAETGDADVAAAAATGAEADGAEADGGEADGGEASDGTADDGAPAAAVAAAPEPVAVADDEPAEA